MISTCDCSSVAKINLKIGISSISFAGDYSARTHYKPRHPTLFNIKNCILHCVPERWLKRIEIHFPHLRKYNSTRIQLFFGRPSTLSCKTRILTEEIRYSVLLSIHLMRKLRVIFNKKYYFKTLR